MGVDTGCLGYQPFESFLGKATTEQAVRTTGGQQLEAGRVGAGTGGGGGSIRIPADTCGKKTMKEMGMILLALQWKP